MTEEASVYVLVSAAAQRLKVGVSIEPQMRCIQVRTPEVYDLEVALVTSFLPRRKAELLEAAGHLVLYDYQADCPGQEWFERPPDSELVSLVDALGLPALAAAQILHSLNRNIPDYDEWKRDATRRQTAAAREAALVAVRGSNRKPKFWRNLSDEQQLQVKTAFERRELDGEKISVAALAEKFGTDSITLYRCAKRYGWSLPGQFGGHKSWPRRKVKP